MRIKKTSQTTTMSAQTVNTYSDSTEDAYACDYVNKALKWKLVKQETGTTAIALPSDFNEIYIESEYNTSVSNIIIAKNQLTSSYQYYTGGGYYISSSDNKTCTWRCTVSNVILNANIFGGNDVKASTKTTVYYR